MKELQPNSISFVNLGMEIVRSHASQEIKQAETCVNCWLLQQILIFVDQIHLSASTKANQLNQMSQETQVKAVIQFMNWHVDMISTVIILAFDCSRLASISLTAERQDQKREQASA